MDDHSKDDPVRKHQGPDESYDDQQGIPSPDDPPPTPSRRDGE